MSFLSEQAILDSYNARYPTLTHYRLVRVSKNHPAVHIAPVQTTREELPTVCGAHLYTGHTLPAEGGNVLCGRCRRTLDRRLVAP